MPNSFAGLAQRFPAEKEGQSLEEQVRELRDYSYQLLEYLRYALQHLDPSNFNETEMEQWITEPIAAEIRDVNGNIAQMQLTAEQFAMRLQNAEGSISQVQQTAAGIQSTVSNQAGQISTLQQTASGIQSTVGDLSGKYSSLKQTVDGFDIEGEVNSVLTNTGIGEINFIYKNTKVGTVAQYGSGSMIIQGAGELLLTAKDGWLQLNSTDGTEINSDGDIELNADGSVSIDASYDVLYLYGGDTTVKVNDNGMSIDNDLWVDGTKIASSDSRVKNTMTYDLDEFAALYRTLKPCRFKYNNGKSGRFHTGFIAQEVEQAIADAGFADTDLAVVVQENHGTEEAGRYGVRYEELIALNTAFVQKLMDEMDSLKQRVTELEGKA